jgi:hypothetical protein
MDLVFLASMLNWGLLLHTFLCGQLSRRQPHLRQLQRYQKDYSCHRLLILMICILILCYSFTRLKVHQFNTEVAEAKMKRIHMANEDYIISQTRRLLT